MIGERILRDIFDQMIERYKISREDWREEIARTLKVGKVWFVHELLECRQKKNMREKFPEIDVATSFNPRLVVGWLIEEAVRNILKAQSQRWYKKIGEVAVAGEADILLDDGGEKTVIEVKYLTGLYGAPHQHHIDQLRLYLWGLGIDRGELWMISPEGIIFTPVTSMTDEDVAELLSESESEMSPRYIFECKLCNYEQFCPYSIIRGKGET